jgi:hypothetical protein
MKYTFTNSLVAPQTGGGMILWGFSEAAPT